MDKITAEMRAKLREPLPTEAVSPHPTKTYLSSIKSIYVVERINEVFGLGTWTLKSDVVERLEKFVVVKSILEIPGYGFYGEAYGGNDNADIGDAYKGATTDGLTKIAAQQLEIGIDVFKGIKSPPRQAPKPVSRPPQATSAKSSPVKAESSSEQAEKDKEAGWPPDPIHAAEVAVKTKAEEVALIKASLKKTIWNEMTWASWLVQRFKLKGGLLEDVIVQMNPEQKNEWAQKVKEKMA